jgi:uncharacterized RDD family membrane protein YckC
MTWYYAAQGQQIGPVDETAFQDLVASGTIQPTTLVWNSEMPSWKPLSEVGSPSGPTSFCSECGAKFPTDEMIQFGTSRVCANCKDRFAQKLREGVSLGVARHYAGFWIRFLARVIDGILFGILFFIFGLVFFGSNGFALLAPYGARNFGIMFLLRLVIAAAYEIFLTAQYGGTLGKLALGLRVITAGGDRLSLGLSTGRYFAQLLSAFTLTIGYIMAGIDDQKRALHDRICNTRVVRT